MTEQPRPPPDWLLLAHRGFSARAPENTLPAFDLAQRAGASGFELDVRLTADLEPVVFHDQTLSRIANRSEARAALRYSELARIDAGSWFAPEFAGARIPRLETVIARYAPRMFLNIELKSDDPGDSRIADETISLLRGMDVNYTRIIISSFNPSLILRSARRWPELPRALLVPPRSRNHLLRDGRMARLCNAQQVNLPVELARPTVIQRWRSRGFAVGIWTIDEPAAVPPLIAAGASHIISNDPAALLAAIYRAPAAQPASYPEFDIE